MKRLVIILLMICPMLAWAKTTLRPMLVKGKTWYYSYHHYNEETGKFDQRTYLVAYFLRGDTVIEDREYKKMYRWDQSSRQTSYHGAFREDEEGRVWQYDYSGNKKDEIICDVACNSYPGYTIGVVSDVTNVEGQLFHRYFWNTLIGVEGVGLQRFGVIWKPEHMYIIAPSVDVYDHDYPGDYEEFEYVMDDNLNLCITKACFEAPKYIQLTENEKKLVEQNNDFAFNLFRKARTGESKVLSPLSVTYALGMLNNGAAGQTQQEIYSVLGFDDVNAQNEFCLKLTNELLWAGNVDYTTKAMISNTIFVNKGRGFELEPDFTHTVNHYYRAYPQSRDFNDGETRGVINKWASDHTEGMIQEVLSESEFNPYAVSYLLNATYFKGMWSCPFEVENTIDEPFAGGEKVPMMHQELEAEYAENDLCQMVRLPYGNGTYNMQVFLPREGKTLDEVIGNLNGKNWKMSGHACDVVLSLPRFETDTDQNLIDVMSELGMPSAFNPYDADFSRMLVGDDDEDDYIGMMKQVAKIKLDEKGTEAAAVTVIEMTDSAPMAVEFRANRPFFYIISEQSTGVILFMGQYMGEGTTGMDEIIHNSQLTASNYRFIMHNDAIYNLQGQRINGLQKGLNIMDGKKIFVK